jgi:hypothetical protein
LISGHCLCGAVGFEVSEPFATVTVCHCTNCKKLSGGTGTVNGRVATAAVRVVAGDEHLRTYQPAEGTAKTFCARCGSNLFGAGWPRSDWTSVRLSALDEPFEATPDRHIYVRSVAPWETLPDDGLPRFETTAEA